MKQVIVRVCETKGLKYKTFIKANYFSNDMYKYTINNDMQELLKRGIFKAGRFIWVKMGSKDSMFIDYDEMKDTLNEYPDDYSSLEEVLADRVNDTLYSVKGFFEGWL